MGFHCGLQRITLLIEVISVHLQLVFRGPPSGHLISSLVGAYGKTFDGDGWNRAPNIWFLLTSLYDNKSKVLKL